MKKIFPDPRCRYFIGKSYKLKKEVYLYSCTDSRPRVWTSPMYICEFTDKGMVKVIDPYILELEEGKQLQVVGIVAEESFLSTREERNEIRDVIFTPEEHMYLKMISTKLGCSMRQFVLEAAFARIEDLEDEWLAKKAYATLKRIESGKEKTIPWKKCKKK